MTDYLKDSGAGQLMIRDTGDIVEFWARSGYSISYNNIHWNFTANGATSSDILYGLHDTSWHKISQVNVTTDQTVTFRLLTATGTTSIAGPTTISAFINRGSPPPAPDPVHFSGVTATHILALFSGNGYGQGTFIRWDLGWGTSSSAPQHIVTSDGSTDVNGLAPGTTYYFWARGYNSAGLGPWSARTSCITQPGAPAPPVASQITQKSLRIDYAGAITGASSRQIGYGTDPNTPSTIITTTGQVITGLQPGTKYYFRARGVNASGAGAWSTAKAVTTLAGAEVIVGGLPKLAVPYVRDGGVWKLVEPWIKDAGVWKKLG